MTPQRTASVFLIAAATLAIVASQSPVPDRVTDRRIYEAAADRMIVPDCSDLQCFRVLVPWILGRVPLPSDVRWKAYATLANAASAAGVFAMCVAAGLSDRAALLAAALSAVGFGSLY